MSRLSLDERIAIDRDVVSTKWAILWFHIDGRSAQGLSFWPTKAEAEENIQIALDYEPYKFCGGFYAKYGEQVKYRDFAWCMPIPIK